MKVPRNLSGHDLAKALRLLGYELTRQTGSHMRLTTMQGGEHHITIPVHDPLRVGTLSAVIGDVAEHFGLDRTEITQRIFGDR
jgi:predicted RNA binding protein YcfA (HicA-like mRNA interferase family)